jgi:PAS domain S-box-containing protein
LFSYENEAAILGIVTDITERKKVEDSLKQAHDELEMRVKERTEELTVANELMQIEIEERKRAESALKLEEEKLRTFLDSSPDAITVTDLSGNIVDCNPATVKQYRYGGKQELINKNALDMIAEQDRARAMRNMEATIREGSVSNVEYLMLRKDGTIYPAELSASVVKDGRGEISRFVAVTKDISERKASEDALLRSQAELREQKKALEQKNIALGEIIAQIEIEKKKIQDDITLNVRRVLIPILDKMVQASDPKPLLAMFRRHLDGLTSTYGSRISEKAANLTPREVEICNMIKGGLSSRDIAELLNISQATVERHRKNIRGKLKLTNQDVNLAVFLRGL